MTSSNWIAGMVGTLAALTVGCGGDPEAHPAGGSSDAPGGGGPGVGGLAAGGSATGATGGTDGSGGSAASGGSAGAGGDVPECERTLGGGPSGPAFNPDYLDSATLAYDHACDTTPLPSPHVTTGHPHEPPGFTRLTERPFTSKAQSNDDRGVLQPDGTYLGGSEGWDGTEWNKTKILWMTDWNDAPQSAPYGFRWFYPHDMASGISPGVAQTVHHKWTNLAQPQPEQEVYVSQHIRISKNWSGNQSNTNKMPNFLGIGNANNNVFFSAEGKFASPLELQWRMQGIADPRGRIHSGYFVQRGVWEHWEWIVRCNSAPYAADGSIEAWVDGIQVLDVHDIVYTKSNGAEAGKPCTWNIFHMAPVYGGGGPYVPHDQWIDVDHVYVSGK
jgi:hypothetical protein